MERNQMLLMRKLVVALSISLSIAAIIIVFQLDRIHRLEQRIINAIDFIPMNESDSLIPMKEDDKDIMIDLWQHKKLIPLKGTLGGTPDYVYIKGAYKLDDHRGYVVVLASDGHIDTDMFLFYAKAKDGSIKWELIAHKREGSQKEWIPSK